MEIFWKNKTKRNQVIRTPVKPKHGFYAILGRQVGGYRQIQEDILEEQFERCTRDTYNETKLLKEEEMNYAK